MSNPPFADSNTDEFWLWQTHNEAEIFFRKNQLDSQVRFAEKQDLAIDDVADTERQRASSMNTDNELAANFEKNRPCGLASAGRRLNQCSLKDQIENRRRAEFDAYQETVVKNIDNIQDSKNTLDNLRIQVENAQFYNTDTARNDIALLQTLYDARYQLMDGVVESNWENTIDEFEKSITKILKDKKYSGPFDPYRNFKLELERRGIITVSRVVPQDGSTNYKFGNYRGDVTFVNGESGWFPKDIINGDSLKLLTAYETAEKIKINSDLYKFKNWRDKTRRRSKSRNNMNAQAAQKVDENIDRLVKEDLFRKNNNLGPFHVVSLEDIDGITFEQVENHKQTLTESEFADINDMAKFQAEFQASVDRTGIGIFDVADFPQG